MHHSDLQPDLDRLRVLESTGLLSSPPPEEFGEICREARERFGVATTVVALLGEDGVIVKASEGADLRDARPLGRLCGDVVRGDDVLVVPDAGEDPRLAMAPRAGGQPFPRFYAGAPLHYVRDIRLGALCLLDHRPRTLAPEDRAELERMAEIVAGAIVSREFDRIAEALAC